jgi:hypothetical protein
VKIIYWGGIILQCPYCNKGMKKGYIQSARPIFWGEEKHKLSFKPEGDAEFSLSKGILTGSVGEAYCCQICKRIVIEFK